MLRRDFLILSACAVAGRTYGDVPMQHWQGRALGADLRLDLVGASKSEARRLWRKVARELEQIEAAASLYRESELRRLNRTGILRNPSPHLYALFQWAERLYHATGGAFDPTVQVLWKAHLEGRDIADARSRIGWRKLHAAPDRITLQPGMALTFNGLVQGYAADRVAGLVKASGFDDALVDMGEIHALGRGPDGTDWSVGIVGLDGTLLRTVRLKDQAMATSSPGATRVGEGQAAHIMHPQGRKTIWGTVSVLARQAVLADGLATAFCLMNRKEIQTTLARFEGASIAFLG